MEKNRIAYEIITLDHNIRRFLINEGKCTPIKNMPSQVQMRIVHYLINSSSVIWSALKRRMLLLSLMAFKTSFSIVYYFLMILTELSHIRKLKELRKLRS